MTELTTLNPSTEEGTITSNIEEEVTTITPSSKNEHEEIIDENNVESPVNINSSMMDNHESTPHKTDSISYTTSNGTTEEVIADINGIDASLTATEMVQNQETDSETFNVQDSNNESSTTSQVDDDKNTVTMNHDNDEQEISGGNVLHQTNSDIPSTHQDEVINSDDDKISSADDINLEVTGESTESYRESEETENINSPTSTKLIEENDLTTPSIYSDDTASEYENSPTWIIHPLSPIPNTDTSLRILRKFVSKTSSHFPTMFGGTKPNSLLSYLFRSAQDSTDECCVIYKNLVDILSDSGITSTTITTSTENEDEDISDSTTTTTTKTEENYTVVENILGQPGDTMAKARLAVASFCALVEIWSTESRRIASLGMGEIALNHQKELEKSRQHKLNTKIGGSNDIITGDLIASALDCAESLVAHGCLDNVMLGAMHRSVSDDVQTLESKENYDTDDGKYMKAIDVMAESIFLIDLSSSPVELGVLKFLLTTGCRTVNGEAMLKGSQLLQTIRVCYRVFLRTQVKANKVTARAALRQIVTGVFSRLDQKGKEAHDSSEDLQFNELAQISTDLSEPFASPTKAADADGSNTVQSESTSFPSGEHRDAYLVFRSLCKLSMKAVSNVYARPGDVESATNGRSENIFNAETDMSLQDFGVNPALDSKILALELILEILQKTQKDTLQNSTPQLIHVVRNYLCHSLLNNCTSDNNIVVNLSLRLFIPIIRHFRSHLKSEIEAFVTNVFFVILDSKNSTTEHKLRVVVLFEEICSDSETLADIFLNYDCDLSAVDLFQRIVNTLAKVAKIGLHDQSMSSTGIFVAGAGATRAEKIRQDHRQLRLEAMKAVRQVLSSLHNCIVTQPSGRIEECEINNSSDNLVYSDRSSVTLSRGDSIETKQNENMENSMEKHALVQIYDSKKKRKEEEAKAILRFNQKPSAGIKYASDVGLIIGDDPADVAKFLLANKDILEKTQIGEYLGREPEYMDGFSLKVLHSYLSQLDLSGLSFDDAIRFFLSGFRLPGEAQKIDRIMEKFAERYTSQNPEVFPTADAAFILAFSVIMLNTDLHNPAIKEERRMTKEGFIRNNRGICDGKDLPDEFLNAIFDRIKVNPISLKEDDEARERMGDTPKRSESNGLVSGRNGSLFASHYIEMDRRREHDYRKERVEILRNTETLLRQKKKTKSTPLKSLGMTKFVRTKESGLKDEYVVPMFDVTWGPALAVFSTAMESANGTLGFLLSVASDSEIELAAENAALTTEVCLSGFQLAIRISALCGNDTARSAFAHALSNFSSLGTGRLLEHRHIRCVQTLLELGRDDGELLGNAWEYVFKAMSEMSRLNSVHEANIKANRVESEILARRKKLLEEELRRKNVEVNRVSESDVASDADETITSSVTEPIPHSDIMEDEHHENDEIFEEEMDKKAIDEVNARCVHESIGVDLVDDIYHRSTLLSTTAVKDFIFQLCRVSRMEIAGYGGHVGSKANAIDLTAVHYRQQHTLLTNTLNNESNNPNQARFNQPDINSLQKLVEVTHYNMDCRPRLVFANLWTIVSGHLTSTALHSNPAVAMYAVDSFRQLSIQFLKREEPNVFQFQRQFLKPFETVMSQCQNASVKEFLLKSIEHMILLFTPEGDGSSNAVNGIECQGTLRSGWKTIFSVIGLASRDTDDAVANLGFSMLTTQLRNNLDIQKMIEKSKGKIDDFGRSKVAPKCIPMKAETFVDLVNALLCYVQGPREDKSSLSIDHLVTLSSYLGDVSIPLPQKTKTSFSDVLDENTPDPTIASHNHSNSNPEVSEALELWWPIMLGLSKAAGDLRPNVRIKSLVTLLAIINQHFLPPKEEVVEDSLQTLQLIFRGVLVPTLEHAETNSSIANSTRSPLPDGFIRFMTKGTQISETMVGGRRISIEEVNRGSSRGNSWLDTTFDHLMDGSIALVLKSLEKYEDDFLVEEVFAMFNFCLLSDSGVLAVRGLNRLHHFITFDLPIESMTDDTWATVSHMLRRCLTVRSLPASDTDIKLDQEIDEETVKDFLREEEILSNKRYIGSNATYIIGSLLMDPRLGTSMGTRWHFFLITGLGLGIRQWDKAASLLTKYPLGKVSNSNEVSPPQYAENALYARKWMVRLLLKLMLKTDTLNITNGKKSPILTLIRDECQALFLAYVEKETAVSPNSSPMQTLEIEHMTKMVCDLLDGMNNLDDIQLASLSSLTITLSACIQINDRTVRTAVHKVMQRILEGQLCAKNNGE